MLGLFHCSETLAFTLCEAEASGALSKGEGEGQRQNRESGWDVVAVVQGEVVWPGDSSGGMGSDWDPDCASRWN